MNVIVQNNNSHHYSHAEHKGLFTGESTPVFSGKQNKIKTLDFLVDSFAN